MRILVFLILLLSYCINHAQDVEEPKRNKLFGVLDFLKRPMMYKSDLTKFSFIKVKLFQDRLGVVEVLSIHPSDSILIRMFPTDYDIRFLKMNFKVLMPKIKQATLIILYFGEEMAAEKYSAPKSWQYMEAMKWLFDYNAFKESGCIYFLTFRLICLY